MGADEMKRKASEGIAEVIPKQRLTWIDRLQIVVSVSKSLFRTLGRPEIQERLGALSYLRDENVCRVAERIAGNAVTMIPKNIDRLDWPGADDIVESVTEATQREYVIKTNDGYVFWDWGGSKKHAALYWMMRDKVARHYSYDTFFASAAVNRSFVNGVKRFPGDAFVPGSGGTIVEAGAYVGYKAVSFARAVGPSGRVVAIEASPENFELLQRNINENRLGSVIEPLNCAVWSSNNEMTLMSKQRMQHTVAEVDGLGFESGGKVSGRTLDRIIDELGLDRVDYLNLQLNGAEVEALEGLTGNLSRIGYINIITRYSRDGILVVDTARRILEEKGCEIVVDCRLERLFNLTARVTG